MNNKFWKGNVHVEVVVLLRLFGSCSPWRWDEHHIKSEVIKQCFLQKLSENYGKTMQKLTRTCSSDSFALLTLSIVFSWHCIWLYASAIISRYTQLSSHVLAIAQWSNLYGLASETIYYHSEGFNACLVYLELILSETTICRFFGACATQRAHKLYLMVYMSEVEPSSSFAALPRSYINKVQEVTEELKIFEDVNTLTTYSSWSNKWLHNNSSARARFWLT